MSLSIMKENPYATFTTDPCHHRHYLIGMYVLTIFAAVFDNTKTMSYLTASIAATILVPFTLWLLNIMIQNKKKDQDEKKEH
jgi:Sec-independent protein secretion pathway component TatC